jgi:hypothetical protein
MHRMTRRAFAVGAVLAAGSAAAGPLHAQDSGELDAATVAALAEVRAATEKYADVEVALADGYLRDPGDLCTLAPVEGLPAELGGMGIHFFRPDLLGLTGTAPRVTGQGTHTDFLQPSVLIYVPQETGAMKLVAVENLVFEGAWRAAGNTGAPEFHGYPYVHRVDDPATPEVDEAHMFEPHYELHVWLYEPNPSGMFSPYNPAVTCEHHDGPMTWAESMAAMQAASAAEHP